MNFRELAGQVFSSMMAHKMRSFLTMFGIIWGIASVIILVGLGIGFNRDQKQRMRTIGVDLAIIWGGRTSAQAGGYAAGREIELSIDDAKAIRDEAYLIKTVSPEHIRPVPEVSEFNAANRPVRGVWPSYQTFRSLKVSDGRLMTQEDEDQAKRVVILGVEAARQLYPGKPAVGATLTMNGWPYTVIGVLEKKKQNGSYGSGPDNTQLFVPYSAMVRDFPRTSNRPGIFRGWLNDIVVEVADPEQHEAAIAQVYQILGRRHHFDPQDKDALMIWDTLQGAKLSARIFNVMTLFFGAVATMTLLLGGIGVMNIMLVSVTERINEIGIRLAFGARPQDIRRQFLLEAVLLCMIGGLLGLSVGYACARVVPSALGWPVEFNERMALMAIACSSLIGIVFGLLPAERAARLDPAQLLRSG